ERETGQRELVPEVEHAERDAARAGIGKSRDGQREDDNYFGGAENHHRPRGYLDPAILQERHGRRADEDAGPPQPRDADVVVRLELAGQDEAEEPVDRPA